MHPTTARVAAALRAAGLETDVREFDETTRTAQQAADTLGVAVGAIVKSLCFMADSVVQWSIVTRTGRAGRLDDGVAVPYSRCEARGDARRGMGSSRNG